MSEGEGLYTIGELARRAGVPVRTVRFWSDAGLLPPAGRQQAAAHVRVVEAEIRASRARLAVLRLISVRGGTTEETLMLHRLARLSAEERRRIVAEFVAGTFGGIDLPEDGAAGLPPGSREARAIVDRIVGEVRDRRALREWLETAADARVERYWELLATLNGHAASPPAVPALAWPAEALRAQER